MTCSPGQSESLTSANGVSYACNSVFIASNSTINVTSFFFDFGGTAPAIPFLPRCAFPYYLRPQQFLYFSPLPQGQGSLGYTFAFSLLTGPFFTVSSLLVLVTLATCSQVGPEIAEHIGLPQVTYAIEAEAEEDRLVIKKEVEAGFEKVAVSYPCLITVTKPSFDPRFPSIKSKMAAKKAEINVLAYADLEAGMDNERIGLKGSPTKVKKTFTPEVKTSGVKISEPTSEEGAEKLFAILCEDKVF